MYNKRLNIISNQRSTYDIIIQCSHTFKYIRHCTTDINRAIINRQLCLLTGLGGNGKENTYMLQAKMIIK
jgi:hypothetical protein